MRLVFVLLASWLLAGCITLPAIMEERELMAADSALAARALVVGAAAAYAEALDENEGLIVRPGAVFEGASDLPAAFAPNTGEFGQEIVLNWAPDRAFTSQTGDLGATSGRYVRTVNGIATSQGRYVTVWRKDAQGRWRVLIDVGNTDPSQSLR
jgi:hypothetical protein